jgi:hypothetical protein
MDLSDQRLRKFLYALWRDVVWDAIPTIIVNEDSTGFLYALWRDVVWDLSAANDFSEPGNSFYTPCGVTLFGTALVAVMYFLVGLFLYALWRDVVWDPTPSGGARDQRRCSLLAQVPRGGPNLAVFSRSVRLFVLVGRLHG